MAFPYKRILCPVDFDENSMLAVEEAKALAVGAGGTILLVHAVLINPLATEGFMVSELQESQLKLAREKLEKIAAERLAGVRYQIEAEIGEPGFVILRLEEKLRADLVVMATHGRRGIGRLVLGSVAERVVRESRIPVLMVRPAK
jgi:nucleotide-binding universal stress UspA family protein